MLIQSPLQGTTQTTTFAGTVSATGVEQPVVRAPIQPVDESKPDARAQNGLRQFGVKERQSGAEDEQAQARWPEDAEQTSASSGETAEEKAARTEASRQKQQMAADQVVIDQLKARDREVRVHEAAHASVGGQYAGSASFEYSRGPDGKNYATGGEVGISTGAVSGDPQATLEKARTIRAAALAPAQPSAQDRRVAAEAVQMEAQAMADLQQMKVDEKMAAEAARQKKQDEAADVAPAVAEDGEENTAVEAVAPPPVVVRAESTDEATRQSADGEAADAPAEQEPRPDARQQLEKILLGSTGLLQQANRMGLVNPQNPYGKSGYLDVIA